MTDGPPVPAVDELDRLDAVARRFEESAREVRSVARRIRQLRAGRAAGRPWHDFVSIRRMEALEMVDRAARRVTEGSAAFRRMLVRGLRREGATVHTIARHLGVSHQRVSVLLRHDTEASPATTAD